MKKKILFSSGGTGGHVFPSISLINFFKKKEYKTIFVTDKRGAKYVKKNFSLHKIFDVGFPTQAGFVNKIFFYLKLILALFNSFLLLRKEKPDFVFGLGGYVSLPICLAAKLLNIKILLYEPNLVLGRVNKYFVRFCSKLFINSNNILNLSNKYLTKCVEVGNILREEIIKYELSKKNNLNSKKTILILGGSQGAEIFGEAIPRVILDINKNYKINVIQQSLPKQVNEIQNFYNENNIENHIFSFHENIVELISKADLAISRCGASTIGELEFLGVPFIAIPYPFAKDDHQYQNAIYYEKKGCCWVLEQKNLSSNNLKKMLIKILDNNVELSLKRENMFKNDSKNSLLKIEKEMEKLI
jgi:UDP-N-acetylglucosamine--N-acetylmuramyl-(pentapeptide) pyrophosphoryl-undecaprenol N-acetylglucosamine transferase